MFERQQQLQLTLSDKNSFKIAKIISLDKKTSHKTFSLPLSFQTIMTLFGRGIA